MKERTAGSLPDRIGGVWIDTPQLREALRKTGEPLTLAACRASEIDEAIERIVQATERGVEHLRGYNARYGTVRHGAGLAVLGNSPLRSPADFKLLVAQAVATRLSAIGVDIHQPDNGMGRTTVRAHVDKVRGLSLLALVQNWRTGSSGAGHEEPEDDAA